ISWSEEIAKYLMVYIVLLGSSLLVRKNGHIAIDFLLEIVNPEVKKKLDFIILIISMIFFSVLTFYGTELTLLVVGQSTPNLQFSMAWAYAAIPSGSLLMILNAFAVLFETIILGRNEREEQVL